MENRNKYEILKQPPPTHLPGGLYKSGMLKESLMTHRQELLMDAASSAPQINC